jgi:exodeoxyribonuclease VII small subunit
VSNCDGPPGGAPLSFEEALAELERVVHDLEEGRIGLSESLERYEQGVRLLKHCHGLLETAERRIELLLGVDAQGRPRTAPFDAQATAAEPEGPQTRSRRRSAPPTEPAPEPPADEGLPGSLF